MTSRLGHRRACSFPRGLSEHLSRPLSHPVGKAASSWPRESTCVQREIPHPTAPVPVMETRPPTKWSRDEGSPQALPNRRLISKKKRHRCLKPLSFGVICYVAVMTRASPEKGLYSDSSPRVGFWGSPARCEGQRSAGAWRLPSAAPNSRAGPCRVSTSHPSQGLSSAPPSIFRGRKAWGEGGWEGVG